MQDMPKTKNQCGFLVTARNERGMALILVLIMLVLLSILGATVFTSTTSDLRITSNYRNLEDAFYTADAAMDFAQAHGIIYTSILPATATVWPTAGAGVIVNDDGTMSTTVNAAYPDYNRVTVYKDAAKTIRNFAYIKVDYISTGAVPPGMGTEVDAGLGSGTGFKANFYAVNVLAEGQSPNNTHVELESHIVRVVPK
jgi:Tfp pilus assembly protein PilX